jgi:DNA-binding response OmpR family regulator
MSKLYGRQVLIVEDHPLILFEIADALCSVGAKPTTAGTLEQALAAVEHDNLAAAILDHALPDTDSRILCEKLGDKNVPIVIYSGRKRVNEPCANATFVEKIASTEMLIATVERLLAA